MDFLAIITALLPLFFNILEQWQAGSPERKRKSEYEELNKNRSAVAGNDAGAVSERVDRLLTDEIGAASNHAGIENGQAGGGESGTLQRLAALGIGDGKVT